MSPATNDCYIHEYAVLHTALALKGIDYEYKAVHLVQDGGQQVWAREYYCLVVYQAFYAFYTVF